MSTTSTIVNEITVIGRVKRRLIDKAAKLWQRISYWTHARDVEFDDGKTAQEKVGNINGITSNLESTKEDIAASIGAVHTVNKELHYRIGNFRIFKGEDGHIYIVDESEGADAVPKKLGSNELEDLENINFNNNNNNNYTKGTWLRFHTISGASDHNIYFIRDKLSITDNDKNFIKSVTGNDDTNGYIYFWRKPGGGNNVEYIFTYIYVVSVNTDTAIVEDTFLPSTFGDYNHGIINIRTAS